jgi:NAD-dependent dihydropyrimidine dehydrogenase PreA subunit
MAEEIRAIAEAPEARESIPVQKWYTPLTRLAQFLFFDRFDAFRGRVRVIAERCESCGSCVGLCGRGAWAMGPGGPVHDGTRCELCGRCLHRCPRNAIVIMKALKDNRRLDSRLYASLEAEARAALGLGPRRSGGRRLAGGAEEGDNVE